MFLNNIIVMCIICTLSSAIGGIIASIIKIKNKEILAVLLEITAGIMTGIVCFDMILEVLRMSSVFFTIFGVIIGVAIIYLIDAYVEKNQLKNKKGGKKSFSIAIMIMISMSFHNFIEGLAIGSSFIYSFSLGITLLISIILHDIPEGIVVGISYKSEGKSVKSVIFNSTISGAVTCIGIVIGQIVGNVNDILIALLLSIAAGAMLYIVSCELIPSANLISKRKKIHIAYIIGILISIFIINI